MSSRARGRVATQIPTAAIKAMKRIAAAYAVAFKDFAPVQVFEQLSTEGGAGTAAIAPAAIGMKFSSKRLVRSSHGPPPGPSARPFHASFGRSNR